MMSDEIRERFERETESPNPDLTLLAELAEAELQLATDQLAHALGPDPEIAFAPPEEEEEIESTQAGGDPAGRMSSDAVRFTIVPPEPSEELPPPPLRVPDIEPVRSDPPGGRCGFCGGRLPAGRTVNFCPHCGQNQSFTRCPECQTEIELGWRHCINCGHLVGEQ